MMITPLYAAIFALFFVFLSVRTLLTRRRLKIALGNGRLGDGSHPQMTRAVRAHSNFAEYVPLGLILLWMLESLGTHSYVIHGLCLCLLIGRLSHAYGISQENENFKFRVFGMSMTFVTIIGSASRIVGFYLFNQP